MDYIEISFTSPASVHSMIFRHRSDLNFYFVITQRNYSYGYMLYVKYYNSSVVMMQYLKIFHYLQ